MARRKHPAVSEKDAEFWRRGRARAAIMGAQAARDVVAKHGCGLAERNLEHLRLDSRRKYADAFDRAYTKAYGEVVRSCRRR